MSIRSSLKVWGLSCKRYKKYDIFDFMTTKKKNTVTYYPTFLNIDAKKCVVVGGGKVALRKVKTLLDCGANVTVISPQFLPEFNRLAKREDIHLIHRDYKIGDLEDATIVIAATDGEKINQRVADEAKKTGVLVNVVDDLDRSGFIVPAFFRRGELTIAVSTAGMSPALAKKIRTILEQIFGEEYASLLSLIKEVRSELKLKGKRVSASTWQEAIDLDMLMGFLRAGQRKEAKAILFQKLKSDHL